MKEQFILVTEKHHHEYLSKVFTPSSFMAHKLLINIDNLVKNSKLLHTEE